MATDEDVEGLTRWASRSHAAERSRLLLALANVVAADDLSRRPRAQACLETLLPALALDADVATRGELAVRLADARWAPASLLDDLAQDQEAIARPLLARSPALSEATLTRAAAEGDADLQRALARRSALPASAIDALVAGGDPDVLLALTGNPRLTLSPEQMDALVETARSVAALRGPLARRLELTADQARRLAARLAPGPAAALAARFGFAPLEPASIDADGAERFVDKLQRAGRLTPGLAVRALRDGRVEVFEAAVAALSGATTEEVHEAAASTDAEPLDRLFAAAGLDRAVAPELRRRLSAAGSAPPA